MDEIAVRPDTGGNDNVEEFYSMDNINYIYDMKNEQFNNSWRKVAAAIYRKPVESKIFVSVEVDITDVEEYITRKRKEGLKITLTHIITLAIARALNDKVPELNCYIKRGNVVKRQKVDAMVSVLLGEDQMTSVLVPDADKVSLSEVAEILNKSIRDSRSGNERKTMESKGMVARFPWPLRNWIVKIARTISVSWGLSIPSVGLSPDSFGSFVVSNIGTIGLDTGYPALFPMSNVAFVIVMGGIFKKPWVVNDKICIRRVITISTAIDHRVVDASSGGRLFRYIKDILRHPEQLESGI